MVSNVDLSLRNTKSIIKGEKFKIFLNDIFKDKTFSNTTIPLYIASTDLQKGKVSYFHNGSITEALMASSAYPGIFPPYSYKGSIYGDGGILDNLPYEFLLEQDTKVLAVNLRTDNQKNTENYDSLFKVISRSVDLMIDNAFRSIYKEDKTFLS